MYVKDILSSFMYVFMYAWMCSSFFARMWVLVFMYSYKYGLCAIAWLEVLFEGKE